MIRTIHNFGLLSLNITELLGVVAVTTFLIGFSTVRLQSSLQDWRQERSRITDRLLQQNAGEDLLPEPVTLRWLGIDQRPLAIGILTWASSILTLGTLIVSVILTSDALWGSNAQAAYQVVQVVHFFVCLLGVIDILNTQRTSKIEINKSPTKAFLKLEGCLKAWLGPEGNRSVAGNAVIDSCKTIDSAIPDWCWLALVRSEIYDFEGNKKAKLHFEQSLRRLRNFSDKRRDTDDYSNTAFIWSSYLVDPITASQTIRQSDIVRVQKFSESRAEAGSPDLMAQLALHCIKRKQPRHSRCQEPTAPLG